MARSLAGTQPGGPRRGSICAEAERGSPDMKSAPNAIFMWRNRERIVFSGPAMWPNSLPLQLPSAEWFGAYLPELGSGRLCLFWRRKRMEERDGFDGCTMGGPGPTDRGVSPSQQNSAWFSLKGKVATQGSGEGRT